MNDKANPSGDKKHILVVEDNNTISTLIKLRLQKENFEVTQIYDGLEAHKYLTGAETKPDVIVLDVMLPEMDGFELLRRIRKNDELKDIKVLILSAKAREEDLVKGLELKADEYMTKPFKIEEFIVRLRKLL